MGNIFICKELNVLFLKDDNKLDLRERNLKIVRYEY